MIGALPLVRGSPFPHLLTKPAHCARYYRTAQDLCYLVCWSAVCFRGGERGASNTRAPRLAASGVEGLCVREFASRSSRVRVDPRSARARRLAPRSRSALYLPSAGVCCPPARPPPTLFLGLYVHSIFILAPRSLARWSNANVSVRVWLWFYCWGRVYMCREGSVWVWGRCARLYLARPTIKAKNSFLATRRHGVVGSRLGPHAANFSMIPPSPKRHKGMEEMEVRWQSAPRPRPADGWLMKNHIYSAAGSASLQRGPGEPPGSTSYNHTSGSSA
jgi:hypothetical protein